MSDVARRQWECSVLVKACFDMWKCGPYNEEWSLLFLGNPLSSDMQSSMKSLKENLTINNDIFPVDLWICSMSDNTPFLRQNVAIPPSNAFHFAQCRQVAYSHACVAGSSPSWIQTYIYKHFCPQGRGLLFEINDEVVTQDPQNHDPVSDQNMSFSKPAFRWFLSCCLLSLPFVLLQGTGCRVGQSDME